MSHNTREAKDRFDYAAAVVTGETKMDIADAIRALAQGLAALSAAVKGIEDAVEEIKGKR